jgi:hypothetical protein
MNCIQQDQFKVEWFVLVSRRCAVIEFSIKQEILEQMSNDMHSKKNCAPWS